MISAIGSFVIQNTWGRLSKEKVIGAALASIACFALYKAYQSLVGRIEQLTAELDKAKKESFEAKRKQLQADRKIKELSELKTKTDLKIMELEKKIKEGDPYLSCEEADDAFVEGNRVEDAAVIPSVKIEKSPKELFIENFPGRHLKYPQETLADVLLKTLFRIDELEECYEEDDHSYTLTYKESKTFVIQDLPAESWKKMNSVIKGGISAALSYKPKVEISSMFQVSFIQEAEGVRISFEKAAITILPFWVGRVKKVTGNITSMLIPKQENGHVVIESEHTIPYVPTSGDAYHGSFASMLPFFFNPTS